MSSIKSLASLAAVLSLGNTYGHAYPTDYRTPEPTAEDRLRAKQKKAKRAETKKRRKQKHKSC